MKKIIKFTIIILLIMLSVKSNAQIVKGKHLIVFTYKREYTFLDENEKFQTDTSYDEESVFKFNNDFTMCEHHTLNRTSNYFMLDKFRVYNEQPEKKIYHGKCMSDVGNLYNIYLNLEDDYLVMTFMLKGKMYNIFFFIKNAIFVPN